MKTMGMVAPRAHQSGRTKSAASPSTVNEIQKILRSIFWIVSLSRHVRSQLVGCGKTSVSDQGIALTMPQSRPPVETRLASSQSRQAAFLPSGFGREFFHHTLDQLFGVGEIFHDQLHIHDRLAGPA